MKWLLSLYCITLSLIPLGSLAQESVSAQPVVYQLPATTYDSVKNILKRSWAPVLKDTIILQYQPAMPADVVNGNDELIQQDVTADLRFLHNTMVTRKNICLLQYAAESPGNEKLKAFNNFLTIDKGNELQQMLLTKFESGSLILLPTGTCVLYPGKEKWAAAKAGPVTIQQLLARKDIATK
jgi:hypothetical protein